MHWCVPIAVHGLEQSKAMVPWWCVPIAEFHTFEHRKQHTLPLVPFHAVIVLCSFRSARKPTNLAFTRYDVSGPLSRMPDSSEPPEIGKKMRSDNRAK